MCRPDWVLGVGHRCRGAWDGCHCCCCTRLGRHSPCAARNWSRASPQRPRFLTSRGVATINRMTAIRDYKMVIIVVIIVIYGWLNIYWWLYWWLSIDSYWWYHLCSYRSGMLVIMLIISEELFMGKPTGKPLQLVLKIWVSCRFCINKSSESTINRGTAIMMTLLNGWLNPITNKGNRWYWL